jgi:regulatory protein
MGRKPRNPSRSSGSSAKPAPTPLDVAARTLARAPRTEADLEAHLVRLGYRPATAAATVARCRELGWVGDVAFAHERARALRARGSGSLKIAADLGARGLDEALAQAAVEASLDGDSEAEWARRALARAHAATPARAWRWLVSHGFPEDVATDVADGVA